jgi:hypothetical protein
MLRVLNLQKLAQSQRDDFVIMFSGTSCFAISCDKTT